MKTKITSLIAYFVLISINVFSQSSWTAGTNLLYSSPSSTTYVGIGTSAPNGFLCVNGAGSANYAISGIGTGSNTPRSGVYGDATGNGIGVYGLSSSGIGGYFSSSTGYGLVVYSGNAGIGTTTPGSNLQINGNAAIGYNSSTAAPSNGLCVSGNVGIGTTLPAKSLDVSGDINFTGTIFWGGTQSGYFNLSSQSTAWGVNALRYGTSGPGACTAVGYDALYNNKYGQSNTAVGDQALYSLNSTDPNTNNTAIGAGAMYFNTTGEGNTAVGYDALYNNSNYSGMYNTAIGYGADVTGTGLGNAIAIGWNVSATAANSIELGNSSDVFCGINGAAYSATNALVVGTSTSNGNGAYCTIGGAWTNGSSIGYKDDITTLNGTDILNKISKLEVKRWKYKETEEYHIGPFAEQFHEFFNTGNDDKHISTIDPSGIALIGIQELIKANDSLKHHQKTIDSIIVAQTALLTALQNCCSQGMINNTIQNNNTQGQVSSVPTVQVVLANNSLPILYQNEPNPFGESTIIRYFIPDNIRNAYIIFYDMYGKELTKTEIISKGFGNVNANAENLASGIYSYSLVVNDNVIDTKKMVKFK